MKKIAKVLAATTLTILGAMPAYAEEPMSVNVARITADTANTIAVNAIKACREKGISISVTVVDRNGIVQVQMRDTVAPPVSLNISKKKAYTSVMFNAKGSQLEGRAKGALPTLDEGLALMAGSTPITGGGKLYGAVGVSGAPDGMDDEACAIAGFESISDDLEMQ